MIDMCRLDPEIFKQRSNNLTFIVAIFEVTINEIEDIFLIKLYVWFWELQPSYYYFVICSTEEIIYDIGVKISMIECFIIKK